MRKLLTACFVILVAAAPALAQDKPVDVNFGFGATFPTGGFADSFDTGWDGTFGVTFNINENLGMQSRVHLLADERAREDDPGQPGSGRGDAALS